VGTTRSSLTAGLFVILLGTRIALAETAGQSDLESLVLSLNTVWVLLASLLVFSMQAGFGTVEVRFIQAKNSASVTMKNFLDFCLAPIRFWGVGYALMFGAGNLLFGTQDSSSWSSRGIRVSRENELKGLD